MSIPIRTPAGSFATILRSLIWAVAAQTGWGLSLQLIALITERLQSIKQRFARLAARPGAGRPAPRRFAPRHPPAVRKPRQTSPLPPQNFGWLLKLLPETVGHRSQLEKLLRDAEMVALMAAAPASMARPLRSLCWMLAIRPPPVLALPQKPRPPRAAPAEKLKRPPRPLRSSVPVWLRPPPGKKLWLPVGICGPPKPA